MLVARLDEVIELPKMLGHLPHRLVGLTAAAGVEDAPVRFDDVRAVVCRVAEPVMLPAREAADRAPEGLQHRVCGRPRAAAVELAVLVGQSDGFVSDFPPSRSVERRVGRAWVSVVVSLGSPYH